MGNIKVRTAYTRPGANPRVKSVNFGAVEDAGPESRVSLTLVDTNSGMQQSGIHYVRTPPRDGSPEGLHTHTWEQTYYLLAGTMMVEIEGDEPFELQAGDAIVFPPGVPHRNWNASDQESVHLSFTTPHTAH